MEAVSTWDDMRLDTRLVEGIKAMKWDKPTAVQQVSIPEALKGRDVAVQARTGTGKTGAFLLPIMQRILIERQNAKRNPSRQGSTPFALILTPSVELAQQTAEAANAIAKFIKPRIVIEDISQRASSTDANLKTADIVVCTASLLAKRMKAGAITSGCLSTLKVVVVDEADYIADVAPSSMQTIQSCLITLSIQTLLFSATLTNGVASIKGQLQRSPTNITLTNEDVESAPAGSKASKTQSDDTPIIENYVRVKDTDDNNLKQFYLIASEECHSHTLLFGLYRMNLITGKTLVFVDDEDETYQLQNFLEQLGVAAAVYDTHLPVNVRVDMLRKFQSGAVSTLLCTDSTLERASADVAAVVGDDDDAPKRKAGKKSRRAEEGGSDMSALHRGIDFSDVRNVIIFDGVEQPTALNFNKYCHRVGRTGRAGQAGTAITIFKVPQARRVLTPLKDYLQTAKNESLKPFKKMERSAAAKLQYRVDTVLTSVTRTATRRLRVATVASEVARSSYLQSQMSEHDTDTLKKIVGRTSRHVKSDRTLLELPNYMHIKADAPKDFRIRVNKTRGSRKEDVFRNVTRKAAVDPLKQVVKKVRHDLAEAKRQDRKAARKSKKD